MKLNKVDIHGYKRFKEKSSMYIDGKITAILGGNEAGKSSFLNAMVHFNSSGDDNKFSNTGANYELSRGYNIPDTQAIVTWHFLLEDEDLIAMNNIPEASKVTKFICSKFKNGKFVNKVYPEVYRDISSRSKLKDELLRVQKNNHFIEHFEKYISEHEHEEYALSIENFNQILTVLEPEEETLEKKVITLLEDIEYIFSKILKVKNRKYLQNIVTLLEEVIKNEKRDAPMEEIEKILGEREPRFLLFGIKDRELKSEYDLEIYDFEDEKNNDRALINLLKTAEIDVLQLKDAMSRQDDNDVKTIIRNANKRLKKKFKNQGWKQSELSPEISNDNYLLKIMFTQDNGEEEILDMVHERSDGLRQFFALFNFINSVEDESKILLIDEAEIHLHYDAQADFIQMLSEQKLTKSVIYTTHSVGCLPEDLGMGVRFIVADKDEKKSHVLNWFWENSKPGFSPILFGMGASTLAFMPLRNAVIVEGAVDHILLPSLFKEAMDKEILGFQVVPGLSNASKSQISEMDNQSPTTVYLTDSDHGEESLHKQLGRAGISGDRVFSLPRTDRDVGIAVEDMIDEYIYVKAINLELKEHNDREYNISIKDIPKNDRANALEILCEKEGLKSLAKRNVAFRILEMKAQGNKILSDDYIDKMKTLFNDLEKKFT